MKQEKSKKQTAKTLRNEEKNFHEEVLQEKIATTENNDDQRGAYKLARFFRWYDYLLMVLIPCFITGVSFIISIFGLHNLSHTAWVLFGFSILGIILWLMLGFFRNRHAIAYYNDTRMRYRKTFTIYEGILQRIRYLILIASLPVLILGIILSVTL